MIAILDYGVGNLFSLRSSLSAIGADSIVTRKPAEIAAAERLILPGVGAFGDAAAKLRGSGLFSLIREQAAGGKPLLGICVGMQLLFERGLEFGEHEGLALLHGSVESIPSRWQSDTRLALPHMGWNVLHFLPEIPPSPLFRGIPDGARVYFVHSYAAFDCADSVIAETDYGIPLTAAVQRGNLYATQFHPEKSGELGLRILRNFTEVQP
ncbi:imidazole glycerol phosphate synthase subunit HisH [Oribacterium sp. oral taxon 102]|uniref:imidazole glycerol phosphate synthase subunit HisH n=1 Tax=Oribacterium sp. oral taxon 102 TaxID=671214 RepID=UPI0015BFB06C|nr:imidazole glycerol phosphate synthase subunit HisH [Oribacterium sp. oral taxon 102]NWO20566.1 imidazole glycerol phosphate synthase subunit HisH [Oribacterium sp. oral taxon 102]